MGFAMNKDNLIIEIYDIKASFTIDWQRQFKWKKQSFEHTPNTTEQSEKSKISRKSEIFSEVTEQKRRQNQNLT